MSAQDHGHWEGELAAWVLGALDQREAETFEDHLAGCERCRADLRFLRPAVDALPVSVTQVAPPPRLRGELLAIVRTEARKASTPQRRRGWWPSWLTMPRPAVAALGAIAVIAAGIVGYSLRGDTDTSTFQANPSPAAAGAEAELVVEDDSGTLHASGLPRLQRDQVFQAWIQNRDQAELEPSTLFVPDRGGTASATIPGLEDAERVMVTREPRGGSAHPTTQPLLQANL